MSANSRRVPQRLVLALQMGEQPVAQGCRSPNTPTTGRCARSRAGRASSPLDTVCVRFATASCLGELCIEICKPESIRGPNSVTCCPPSTCGTGQPKRYCIGSARQRWRGAVAIYLYSSCQTRPCCCQWLPSCSRAHTRSACPLAVRRLASSNGMSTSIISSRLACAVLSGAVMAVIAALRYSV